jgi:hypothetical protein
LWYWLHQIGPEQAVNVSKIQLPVTAQQLTELTMLFWFAVLVFLLLKTLLFK